MVVFDSNIFIYFGTGKLDLDIIRNLDVCYASISSIEVLGYYSITSAEERKLKQILDSYQAIDLSDSIIQKAIELRQFKNLSLGDSIIAATAIDVNKPLWTANEKDFAGIKGITIFNPVKI